MLHSPESTHSRRQFLLCSSAFSLAGLFPLRLSAQRAGSEEPQKDDPQLEIIPKDTLLKFNPDGSPRPFAGNTVICHLPQQSRFHDAVAALGDALRSSSFGTKLAVLPSDSYHATILGGPNDQDRRRYGWPSDIPINTPIAECNRIIGERIARFRMHTELPLRFRLDKEKTLAPQRPCGLQLVPADANEKLKLRTLRDRMATEVFRYRAPGHDTFGFHISLAYQMRGFTAGERQHYQDLLAQNLTMIDAATSIIELGVPEFSTFVDMYRFEVQTLLCT
ncbi:DUF1868 domain-containing protein [Edaphobacter modestus]|uniref:DUF1868 domain-containing protein n=1 Tax=Edaphobacter modestus TaxID=388466 RepID=A0A4V2G570_9BACT|nr:DUF1868 domain-containing protein [Edaphobacter modestus]RZU43656.1 hypothetical protein BDD14_5343 [Edaphobacter modestus]